MVTSAPYLCNAASAPPGSHYTWIIPPYPDDLLAYAAWAQQAAHGAWLFKLKFTALPHHGFFFNPFFLICGWLAAFFLCDIGIVFWVAKAVGVVLFLTVFYRYIDYLNLDAVASIAASILAGISSGFGGLLVFMGWASQSWTSSADLWMPEMSTYWSLLWNPLFPFSLTLLLLSIYWLDRGSRDGSTTDFWRSGLLTGVMALIHPYSIPLLFAFAAIVTGARQLKASWGYLARYVGAILPFLGWVIWMSQTNRLVSQHTILGRMNSPRLIMLLLGFGLPLLLAISLLALKKGFFARKYWHLLAWFLLSVTLAYCPFWFQRKLVFGAHVSLSILGGVAFAAISSQLASSWKLKSGYAAILPALLLMPLLVATPLHLHGILHEKVRLNKGGAYFISEDLMAGLQVLRNSSNPDDVVMAAPPTSLLIPAFAGNTVVWGHWAMSIDLKERQEWMENVLNPESGWTDEKRASAFWGNDIQFVFADGALKESLETRPLVWGFILRGAQKIFANNSVIIYRRPAGL